MFSISIESGFSAIHRVQLPDGSWEPWNGHDWRVRATYTAPALDEHGMVVDFRVAQEALNALVGRLHHTSLNDHSALCPAPTAEVLARWLYEELRRNGPRGLARVEVTEAPGCTAAYAAESTSRHTD